MPTARSPLQRNGTPELRAAKICAGAALLALATGCTGPRLHPVSGEDTFTVHCSTCHGTNGAGNGPDAGSLPVPDLRSLARRNGGVFPEAEVARYIDGTVMPAAHGERNMPVWGPVFDATSRIVEGADPAAQRIDAVIGYLRSLQTE